jgi:hypothetical protein
MKLENNQMQVDRYAVDVYNALDLVDDLVDHKDMDFGDAVKLAAQRFNVKVSEVMEAYYGVY